MTATTAGDRLADTFPHGTPAGFRLGCKGAGGCRNRDTDLMTCREANLRYHRDLTYRRAIDAGEMPLNREAELKDRDVRARRVERASRPVPVRAVQPVEIPTPAPATVPRTQPETVPTPAPVETRPADEGPLYVEYTLPTEPLPASTFQVFEKPTRPRERGWKHGVYGYEAKGCRCDICVAAVHEKKRRSQIRRTELATNADAASQRLLLDEQIARRKAEEIAAHQQRELDQLREDNRRLLADLEALTAAPPPKAATAPHSTVHAGSTPDGGIQLRLTGVEAIAIIEPETLRLLAEHFRVA